MKIDDLDRDMINKILQEIAIHYPFSFNDIRSIFEYTKSFDATIQGCESAVRLGIVNPVNAIEVIQSVSGLRFVGVK